MQPIRRSARSWHSSCIGQSRHSSFSRLQAAAQRSIMESSDFLGYHLAPRRRLGTPSLGSLITMHLLRSRTEYPSPLCPSLSSVPAWPATPRTYLGRYQSSSQTDSLEISSSPRTAGTRPRSCGYQEDRSSSSADTAPSAPGLLLSLPSVVLPFSLPSSLPPNQDRCNSRGGDSKCMRLLSPRGGVWREVGG